MIDYCEGGGHLNAWPDVVCFETLGHCDALDGSSTEDNMITCLNGHGYCTLMVGADTVMVRDAALRARSRLRRWLDGVDCM